MHPQEIFNTVATHLFIQGVQSLQKDTEDEIKICFYRGTNETKCALGILISDEDYKPEMEGWNIGGLIDRKFRLPEWIVENRNLIDWLQTVHDNKANWKDTNKMQMALIDVAVRFNLDATIVQTLKFENR